MLLTGFKSLTYCFRVVTQSLLDQKWLSYDT